MQTVLFTVHRLRGRGKRKERKERRREEENGRRRNNIYEKDGRRKCRG